MQKIRTAVNLLIISCFSVFFNPCPVFSQTTQTGNDSWSMLIGTSGGLVGVNQAGKSEFLWIGGEVKKIFWQNTADVMRTVILSSGGILVSEDLQNWTHRDQGLPVRTIKVLQDGKISFITEFQEIKDLEIDPQNPDIMVCAVKNAVYLTRNGGGTWENLGMPNYRSDGIKAAAVTTLGNDLTVFCSHNIYGFYYLMPAKAGSRWEELNKGLLTLETTNNPDEISDIAVRLTGNNARPEIIVSQTFRQRIYRLDWAAKEFELLWSGGQDFGTIESLSPYRDSLRFIQDANILEFTIPEKGQVRSAAIRQRRDLADIVKAIPANLDLNPVCVMFRVNQNRSTEYISLNELWLVPEKTTEQKNMAGANREGIYLPVNHAMDPYSLAPYMETIKNQNLNMVVIDMKDDYGRLRFTPQNAELAKWGRVFRPVDIEVFLKQMKDAGIYTVARIVVFKDPEAASKNNGAYAVWDSRNNIPWEGYYDTRQKKNTAADNSSNNKTMILPAQDPDWEILRTYYDEKWVDPYAPEFWEYIADLSEELSGRGFDEIQFDYIRFPTDGQNLADASYRWFSQGMDMDSAIISFLRNVRQKVKTPISVDIYGANGWYRTGARTGQEVEMLAELVDIICPMYYPSHFEQDFLAQDPPELRPYRIYHDGVLRTSRIAREKVVVRRWAQAFYLNVSYDRRYYNADYVRRQLEGVRDAGNGGLTYWNNLGRYEDIPVH